MKLTDLPLDVFYYHIFPCLSIETLCNLSQADSKFKKYMSEYGKSSRILDNINFIRCDYQTVCDCSNAGLIAECEMLYSALYRKEFDKIKYHMDLEFKSETFIEIVINFYKNPVDLEKLRKVTLDNQDYQEYFDYLINECVNSCFQDAVSQTRLVWVPTCEYFRQRGDVRLIECNCKEHRYFSTPYGQKNLKLWNNRKRLLGMF